MAGETFLSVFTGTTQSRYAGLAILMAIIVVSLVILFGKDNIPFSQKFSFVLLIFLISLPSILLSLFQITCLVKGVGSNYQRWWCGAYAWIISAILIIYCILLVFVAVTALITGEKVLDSIRSNDKAELARNKETANMLVEEYFTQQGQYAQAGNESSGVIKSVTTEQPEELNAGSEQPSFNIPSGEYNLSPKNNAPQIQQLTGNPSPPMQQLNSAPSNPMQQLANMYGSSIQMPPDMNDNMESNVDSFTNRSLTLGGTSLPGTYNSSSDPYRAMTDYGAYGM
jgi:hypothetical protein